MIRDVISAELLEAEMTRQGIRLGDEITRFAAREKDAARSAAAAAGFSRAAGEHCAVAGH